jgi:hypothetical protein
VTLNVKATNGCNYYGSKPIVIRSPFGTVRYKSNYSCIDETLRFEALPENTDSIRWNFGDGTTFTTTERVVFYKYKLPGTYLPKIEFVSSAGCSYLPPMRDSIRIDRVNAGFKSVREEICGSTKVIFRVVLPGFALIFFSKNSIISALRFAGCKLNSTVRVCICFTVSKRDMVCNLNSKLFGWLNLFLNEPLIHTFCPTSK